MPAVGRVNPFFTLEATIVDRPERLRNLFSLAEVFILASLNVEMLLDTGLRNKSGVWNKPCCLSYRHH